MNETARALHTIRAAELDAARRVELARDAAADSVSDLRQERAQALAEAERRGRAEAERRLAASVAAAEQEAEAILAGCDERIESLRRSAEPHRSDAVAAMVDLLLAPPLEKGK